MYAVKNLSDKYIEQVLNTIGKFITFLKCYKFNWYDENEFNINFEMINASDIYFYLFFLTENGYSKNMRNKQIIHLRLFFRYLYMINKVSRNIATTVTTEKTYKQESAYLTIENAKKLLQYLKKKGTENGEKSNI